MKTAFYLLAFLFLATVSCKKDKNNPIGENFGCINRVWISPNDYTINATDYANAIQLFQQNNIPFNNLRFTRVMHDTIAGALYVTFGCDQYINGLPILNAGMNYEFKNGQLNYLSGHPITSTPLDTIPTLKIAQVRKLYVNQLETQKTPPYMRPFKDSCLTTQFGYYDINAATGVRPANLVKAWYVQQQNSGYPIAYFKDDGTLIGFDTGIVFVY